MTYFGEVPNTWLPDLISWILPTLLLFGVWMFVVRRFAQQGAGGGLMAIGKSRAKIYVEKDTRVTFADVAGVEEAKDELKEIVDFFVRSEGIGTARRAHPEGYPAGRSARYRQDAAGARSCGRSGRQILLNLIQMLINK